MARYKQVGSQAPLVHPLSSTPNFELRRDVYSLTNTPRSAHVRRVTPPPSSQLKLGAEQLRHRAGYANSILHLVGYNGFGVGTGEVGMNALLIKSRPREVGRVETSSTAAVCIRRLVLSAPGWRIDLG